MLLIPELDGIFGLREEQRMAPMAFLCGKDVFALLSTYFVKSLAKHRVHWSSPQVSETHQVSSLASIGSLMLLLPASKKKKKHLTGQL